MTQIAIRKSPEPVALNLEMGSAIRLNDEELLELCRRNRELRIERTREGDLIVMTPAGGSSSRRNARVVAALLNWADEDGSGVVYDSSGGFLLDNGAMRAPDAAWVRRSRLAKIPPEELEGFVPLCPDFVVEIRSPSDALPELEAKMEEYLDNGARLGWLIDPSRRRVSVYRPGRPVEVLEEPGEIAGDPELPGFVFSLGPVWQLD
ncbi:MAG: Uma2 family endonuclease [Thermoanaerobaculia bacterium]